MTFFLVSWFKKISFSLKQSLSFSSFFFVGGNDLSEFLYFSSRIAKQRLWLCLYLCLCVFVYISAFVSVSGSVHTPAQDLAEQPTHAVHDGIYI